MDISRGFELWEKDFQTIFGENGREEVLVDKHFLGIGEMISKDIFKPWFDERGYATSGLELDLLEERIEHKRYFELKPITTQTLERIKTNKLKEIAACVKLFV